MVLWGGAVSYERGTPLHEGGIKRHINQVWPMFSCFAKECAKGTSLGETKTYFNKHDAHHLSGRSQYIRCSTYHPRETNPAGIGTRH